MTEVKTQKISEEKQTTSAGAELKQTIAYLAERATNLSNYSAQLRSAVEKIAVAVSRYNPHMTIVGEIFFTNEKGADYMLHFDDTGLYVKKVEYGLESFVALADCSKNAIKAMVPEIPKFLKYAVEQIAIAEQEYKQVSEIAEKMANAIQ